LIPVNEPWFGAREAEYVRECVETGWVSSAGKFIDQFEREWAAYCGKAHGVAVSNGTVALEVAVRCLGLAPGDEVILPSFTIISCALAVIYNGGVPVLVDCDPQTWCLDAAQVAARITPRTRAIMPVHMYGHPADLDPILDLADAHGLAVIEDAAEAHGAEYLTRRGGTPQWRRCGGFGRLSTFSFYANKLITTGDGGMVLMDQAADAERARSVRNLCFQEGRRFFHTELGHNFRLTNLQAALGVAQLERMDEIVRKKRWMGQAYAERLGGIGALQLPIEAPWARQVYWMYGVVLDESVGYDAVELAKRLAAEDVQTRPFFLGMHEQPALRKRGLFRNQSYPVSERLARQGLYLPSGLGLDEKQIECICRSVAEVLE